MAGAERLDDRHVRFRSAALGVELDALVLRDPDPDRPETMLVEVLGPAPPEDQPGKYARHSEQFAGMTVPDGDELESLPRPDPENTVRPVDDADRWPAGEWIREHRDRDAFERAEFGETLAERMAREHPTLDQLLTQWENDPDGYPLEEDWT